MLVNTARVIHIGLNYIIAPKRPLTNDEKLLFQKELHTIGLDAENVVKKEGGLGIKATYDGTQVVVENFMNSPNTGQLLIIMPDNPNSSLYPKIADAVLDVYVKTLLDSETVVFPAKDGCIRKLYSCSAEYPHAFKYIWEKMLGKESSELSALGKPIHGGGLRFVMPPIPDESIQTEVKIESFLQDPKLLWVEVIMKWLQPENAATGVKATELYNQMNEYLDKNVVALLSGE